MPKISSKKREKIQEQILHHLFTISPESHFTSKIAEEIARDEEFTKSLLQDLKSKSLIKEINKNSYGKQYSKRQRWSLSSETFNAYSKHQKTS
jgi:predicted transcriptional regulator with HTH domain